MEEITFSDIKNHLLEKALEYEGFLSEETLGREIEQAFMSGLILGMKKRLVGLTEKQQKVFELKTDRKSYRQIAEQLGVSKTAIIKMYYRGIRNIKKRVLYNDK